MKFRAAATFDDISVSDYEQIYFDEAFNDAMCKAVRLERTVIKSERNGDILVRHTRVAPQGREIPAPAAKILGAQRIEYIEEITYDFSKHHGTWRTIPSVMPEKIESKGTLSIVAAGSGSTRISEGEINVKVFGVGGIVEKFIVSDVEKSYEDAAAFTRDYWKKQKG